MSERPEDQPTGLSALAIAQIAASVVVQFVILMTVDAFWAICATPVAFSLFAAAHMQHLDSERERQFKQLLTVLALISIVAAVLIRWILHWR